MNHTIAKTVFNVTADKSLDGFALQQELSNVFWHTLSSAFDKVFEDLGFKDKTLIINTLELDLGEINIKNWQQVLTDKLIEALREALKKQAAIASTQFSDKGKDAETPIILPQRERLFEAWLYFLKTGQLPPSVSTDFDESLWLKSVAETLTLSETAERTFKGLLKTDPSLLNRLVLQFDETFLAQIAAILMRTSLEKLPNLRLSFIPLFKKLTSEFLKGRTTDEKSRLFKKDLEKIQTTYSKHAFWTSIFQSMALDNSAKTAAEVLVFSPFKAQVEVLASSPSSTEWQAFFQQFSSIEQHTKAFKSTNFDIRAWRDLCKNLLKTIKVTKQKTGKDSVFSKEKEKNIANPDTSGTEGSKKAKVQAVKNKRPDNADTQNPKLETQNVNTDTQNYIKNAGVVLTHAFLPMFFKALKLVNDKKQFRNETARHRAIHLVQYLASGVEGLPEYRLVLPKLLCGLRTDIPIERNIILKKKEKAEAEDLLKAVIKHWAIVGNISTDTLRETFFKRDGKFSQTEKGPLIQIEQRTEDILLTRLPWSISMIKLPWMQEMLFVEWP